MNNDVLRYPIGLQDFEGLKKDGYIYIDKTAILYKLIKSGKYYFMSRPRRFGKSLTLSTLKAIFEGKKELFQGLAIYDLEKEWKKHPVFLLSFATFEKSEEKSLEQLIEFKLNQWETEYRIEPSNQKYSVRFGALLKRAYEQTGERAVVLIDEYDSALVTTMENESLHTHIKNILRPLYTVIKDYDQYIRFTFITGITRFSKLTIFSGLNNLNDITLNKEYSTICGITQKELETTFKEGINQLCQRYKLDYAEMIVKLKDYYDGYHFSEESEDVYNPFSLLNAFFNKKLSNYWFSTGIPSFLVEKLKRKDVNLEKYFSQRANEEILQESDNSSISELSILFQSGFLTIKNYDITNQTYGLGIPNREVREGMVKLFMEYYLCPNKLEGQRIIFELVDALEGGDPDRFLRLLRSFLSSVPYDLSKGDKEVYFQNAFYIIVSLIGLTVKAECHTSNGSIDLVITTDEYIYVIELKLDKNAIDALRQINEKGYARTWEFDKRKLYKIGVSFSSLNRNVEDWIID